MKNRVQLRYSRASKRQVVEEIESGRFSGPKAASNHYGINGATTVRDWCRRMGKNHLLAKVVRVEQVGEADQLALLKKQIERLQRSLGQTQADSLLTGEYLKMACERLGEGVEEFKKKSDGRQFIG